MLVKFSVMNFKNFKNRLELNLETSYSYNFNRTAVKEVKEGVVPESNVVSKALVYGINGSGKTNLGLAILDLTLHLTDNERVEGFYRPYLNMDSESDRAEFRYEFVFGGKRVVYEYAKRDSRTLIYERLFIDGEEVIDYDFVIGEGSPVRLEGAENLCLSAKGNPISRVRYVMNNAVLSESPKNAAFLSFKDFVNHMLYFRSLKDNVYIGLQSGGCDCLNGIIRNGGLERFEEFLRRLGIDYHMYVKEVNGNPEIFCRFKNGDVNFRNVASTGTNSLSVFFYWYMMLDKASFVFIDEFDAFYHYDLAAGVVELLRDSLDAQVILSSHDTDIISNKLLRPDCYFKLNDGAIKSFDNLTDMDIREEHNMQRMYKAGTFNG